MAEKVTIMKLKVDLECDKCCKKVKKVLAKFPQIRDQKYDEKQNMVTITVVCCSPEKIRDKLCYKAGGSIKSIEIVQQSKPKPDDSQKNKDADKSKQDAPKPDKPKPASEPDKKKGADKPKADAEKPKDKPKADAEKPKDKPKGDADKPKDKPKEKPPESNPAPPPVQAYPPAQLVVPVGMCYGPCYESVPPQPPPGGPCVNGYGYAGPPVYYDGYYGRPVYDSYSAGRPYYAGRCDQYFSEENASGCSIM